MGGGGGGGRDGRERLNVKTSTVLLFYQDTGLWTNAAIFLV